MLEPDPRLFGYFDAPHQTSPAYDPGREAICPECLRALGDDPVRTHSLVVPGDKRCFFWRVHKACETDELIDRVEGALVASREGK